MRREERMRRGERSGGSGYSKRVDAQKIVRTIYLIIPAALVLFSIILIYVGLSARDFAGGVAVGLSLLIMKYGLDSMFDIIKEMLKKQA